MENKPASLLVVSLSAARVEKLEGEGQVTKNSKITHITLFYTIVSSILQIKARQNGKEPASLTSCDSAFRAYSYRHIGIRPQQSRHYMYNYHILGPCCNKRPYHMVQCLDTRNNLEGKGRITTIRVKFHLMA